MAEMNSMREVLNEEVKDLKSANKTFSYELERNQNLFRQLQQELVLTMEEKKVQNDAIMDGAKNL